MMALIYLILQTSKTTIFRFKLNASGNITALYDADNAEFEGTVLGYATAGKNGITFKNNSVETNNGSKSIDSDCSILQVQR